jgi:hypothetical protein
MNTKEDMTLTQLEGDDWGPPPPDAPPTVERCYQLRHKVLRDFAVEDLRIMIGQDVGLPYLLPKAIMVLESEPLAEGMHYRGDLLCSVLHVTPSYYRQHPDLKTKISAIISQAREDLKLTGEIDYEITSEALDEALAEYEKGTA